MADTLTAKKVLNGTDGKVWVNGKLMAEVSRIQMTVNIIRKQQPAMNTPNGYIEKMTGRDVSGSMTLSYVDSYILKACLDALERGEEFEFTVTSTMYTSDKKKSESVTAHSCKFDQIVLADFGAGELVSRNLTFKGEYGKLRQSLVQ